MLARKSAFWACVWLTPLLDTNNAKSFQPYLELPKGCENDFFTNYDCYNSWCTSFLFILFLFACAGSLLLPGLSLIAGSGGFSYSGAQALGHLGFSSCGSQALEHWLNSCNDRFNCSALCGMFPDQGSDPCLLHTGRWILYHWATGKAILLLFFLIYLFNSSWSIILY